LAGIVYYFWFFSNNGHFGTDSFVELCYWTVCLWLLE